MTTLPEKKIFFITLLMIAIAAFTQVSCTSGSFRLMDRREGIEKGVLRVYIRDEAADTDGFDAKKEKKMWETFLTKGKERAIHLILSHIRSLTQDSQKYSIFDDMILKSLNSGVMVFRECTDEYCEAFIDYQVKDLMDSITGTLKGGEVRK